MKPQPKHQPLFFTPRTPWGTRLPGRSFYDHMRASDAVPDGKRTILQKVGGALGSAGHWIGDHLQISGGAETDPTGKPGAYVQAGLRWGREPKKEVESEKSGGGAGVPDAKRMPVFSTGGESGGKAPPDKMIMLRGASDEYVNQRNKSFQDSLRRSGIDPTGKTLFTNK